MTCTAIYTYEEKRLEMCFEPQVSTFFFFLQLMNITCTATMRTNTYQWDDKWWWGFEDGEGTMAQGWAGLRQIRVLSPVCFFSILTISIYRYATYVYKRHQHHHSLLHNTTGLYHPWKNPGVFFFSYFSFFLLTIVYRYTTHWHTIATPTPPLPPSSNISPSTILGCTAHERSSNDNTIVWAFFYHPLLLRGLKTRICLEPAHPCAIVPSSSLNPRHHLSSHW